MTSQPRSTSTLYGAIDNSDTTEDKQQHQQEQGEIFDPNNTYYLKDEGKWNYQKIIQMSIPLIGAVLIIGGAVVFLLGDFNHLYPGHGGSSDDATVSRSDESSTIRIPSIPILPPPRPAPLKAVSTKTDPVPKSNTSSCLLHTDCHGLIGECCPTLDGMFLDCCSS